MLTLQVSEQEIHTLLAALRFYQERGQADPHNRSAWIDDIATSGGMVTALDEHAIDELCLRLNVPAKG